ncbi:MAG: inositol monophosphatase family protein [Dehalococcoidia bacterium]
MPEQHDPAALLALATAVALEAADLLAQWARRPRSGVATKSSLTDMVSDADRASERLIVERILAARPGDAILGEEDGARDGVSGLRWVIDPLDGTTNFLYGIPAYAVSIGLEDSEGALAAVVADAARGELFAAARGRGATLDGRPIEVSRPPNLGVALTGTGFGYDADRRRRQVEVVARVLPQVRDIRRGGSAALDLCYLACGRLDAYFEAGLGPWDYAAGALIVREAGGVTEFVEVAPGLPPALLASGDAIWPSFRALLAGAGAHAS